MTFGITFLLQEEPQAHSHIPHTHHTFHQFHHENKYKRGTHGEFNRKANVIPIKQKIEKHKRRRMNSQISVQFAPVLFRQMNYTRYISLFGPQKKKERKKEEKQYRRTTIIVLWHR